MTVCGRTGHAQYPCGLDDGESGEEAQFDDLRLIRCLGRQASQRFVESKQVDRGRKGDKGIRFDLRSSMPAAVFEAPAAPRAFDQDATHGLRRSAQEMSAIPEFMDRSARRVNRTGDAHPCLVDQRRRVERLRAFMPKLASGESPQLRVECGDQLVVGSGVARAERVEESCDVGHGLESIPDKRVVDVRSAVEMETATRRRGELPFPARCVR